MDAQGTAVGGDARWTNPRWEYPEYPPGSIVELRVHGVGGEGPEGMTRDPHPRNVGGDRLAGFWRARNPVVRRLDGSDEGPLHVREVLAWGGQTSGTMRHAFWVLLLPFALFNVAGRMHPADSGGARAGWHRRVCRVLAYTMTLGVVGLSCATAFDLFGAQYTAPDPEAQEAPTGSWLLAPLRYFTDPAPRMAFVALLPVLVIVLLWQAGRYRTPDLEGHGETGATAAEPNSLQDPAFWNNAWPASRLRAAHASGGLALVGATLALIMGDVGPEEHRWVWNAALAVAAAVVVACGVVAGSAAVVQPGRSAPLHHLQWVLRLLGLGVLVFAVTVGMAEYLPHPSGAAVVLVLGGAVAVGWWTYTSIDAASQTKPQTKTWHNLVLAVGLGLAVAAFPVEAARLIAGSPVTALGELPDSMNWLGQLGEWLEDLTPGLYLPAYALLLPLTAVQVVLLVGLLCTGVERTFAPRPGAPPPSRGFPWNTGGAVAALLALLVILAVGASLHALTIDWLGERRQPDGSEGFVLPWWYSLAAQVAAFVLPACVVVAFVARTIHRRWSAPKPDPADVAVDLDRGLDTGPADPADVHDERRLTGIAGLWRMQRLVRDGGHVMAAAVALTLVVVVLVFVLGDPVHQELRGTSAAVWVVTLMPGFAVGLIRSSMRNRDQRRQIAALWDVLAFWPRVTHPFAPPCYGEAVVPMLAQRVQQLTSVEDKHYQVVLAGHSQGSVVSLAAVVQAAPNSVHLVTYGSPIAILYERFFPGVFGEPDGTIAAGQGQVLSWHHLFAMTEPFAMPFWAVADADDAECRSGWQANRKIPHADTTCPVCGWQRSVPTPIPAPTGCTDYVVSDPDRWQPALDPVHPDSKGHSTYHDSREVDEHLIHLVRRVAGLP